MGRNGDLLGFWSVLGCGHLEKFWAWVKNRKTQFSGARGPKIEKKVSGMVVRNFFTFQVLADRTPRGGKSQNTGILGHFGLWHLMKSRARAENGKKRNFPALGIPKSKNNVTTLTRIVVCNFFTLCVSTDRTPRGGKSENIGFLGPFGLGQPLGTEGNSGPKTEKCNFPELGALLGGKSVRPTSFSTKLRTFLTICGLADRTPTGGKSQNTGVLCPFGLGQPFGT